MTSSMKSADIMTSLLGVEMTLSVSTVFLALLLPRMDAEISVTQMSDRVVVTQFDDCAASWSTYRHRSVEVSRDPDGQTIRRGRNILRDPVCLRTRGSVEVHAAHGTYGEVGWRPVSDPETSLSAPNPSRTSAPWSGKGGSRMLSWRDGRVWHHSWETNTRNASTWISTFQREVNIIERLICFENLYYCVYTTI